MTEYADMDSSPGWNEADRLAALHAFRILDTEPELAFDSIVKIAAHVCDAPMAIINFIDRHRQWFKAGIGVGIRETPLDIAVCTHAIRQPGIFVIPDMTKDSRFSSNPAVTGEPHLRFYASASLQTDDGLPLGRLCVLDRRPRPEGLTPQQSETLLALARTVMDQLKLRMLTAVDAAGQDRPSLGAGPNNGNERSTGLDPLTGLPNRATLLRRLEDVLADARGKDSRVSLLLIDLDSFKDLNDAFGHEAGDGVLKETAARLSELRRSGDIVAHMGADEFALVTVDSSGRDSAVRLGSLAIEALRRPFHQGDRTIDSNARIGIAVFPVHGLTAGDLLRDAAIALDEAKRRGRYRIVTYSQVMGRSTEKRISLIQGMREAIAQDRIKPFYQPKVCLLTGRILGLEALARWQHPDRGLLTPAAFASTFEHGELAADIGQLMAENISADMRRWLDLGLDFGRVALNMSQAEFDQPRPVDRILRIFEQAGVPAHHLEIEVPETVALGSASKRISSILAEFHRHGVSIALDDFGTGYASLMHLKQLPVDHIKIDRSFVADLDRDAGSEVIVRAIIGLGTNLGLHVTAEGVEDAVRARHLRELGCHSAQGYFYARPAAASRMPEILTNWAESSFTGDAQQSA